MAEITVNNVDWSVLSAVRDALANATIEQSSVLREVAIVNDERQIQDRLLSGNAPKAVVVFHQTDQTLGLQEEVNCVVSMTIVLLGKVAGGVAAEGRLQEAMRLKNAAINAIEASPPPVACDTASDAKVQPAVKWGKAQLQLKPEVQSPWILCRQPLEVAYRLNNRVSH